MERTCEARRKRGEMNETIKSMQHLNNADKRAVRAYRILSHAFFTLPSNCVEAGNLLLNKRNEVMNTLPSESHIRATKVACMIKDANWERWIDEARACGNR